jgi:hypothetical protein
MALFSQTRSVAAHHGLLLLIAVLSVLPRLLHLGDGIWNDEIFSTHVWLEFSRRTFAWMAYDTHPPVYHLLMLFWVSVFGDSPVSIRLLPLVCSAASVYWMGRVAAYLVGPTGGVLAAALLALSGASIFYAQEARSYSLVILLLLLMSESLLRYVRGGESRMLKRLVLFSLLCAVIHVYAFLFVLCFWALVLLTARTPREATALARAAMVVPAVAAPFYFLIALLILFTEKHESLWAGLTYTFTPPDAAALLSFYLFGYRVVDAPFVVHALSALAFLAGVALALKRPLAAVEEARDTDFAPHWLSRLFRWSVALGLAGSVAAVAAPWWLPRPETMQAFVGAGKHPDLIAAFPRLVQRTGLLYVLGYGALLGLWVALDRLDRRALPVSWAGLKGRVRAPLLTPPQVLVVLPLVAILVVMAVCYFRPTYNYRYMLGLLPFAVLAMGVALWRLWPGWPRAVLAGLVVAGQAFVLVDERDAYALRKPDYRSALTYVSRLGLPVTGTAMWELDNLSRYYAGRGEIEPVTIVPQPAAGQAASVVVFEPHAYPLDAPHRAELREAVQRRAARKVPFAGLTLYELGPMEAAEQDRRVSLTRLATGSEAAVSTAR